MSFLGERARLSPEHLRRAVDWNAHTDNPLVTLPGGQTLPTGHADAAIEDRQHG